MLSSVSALYKGVKIRFDDDESDDDQKRLVIAKQPHHTAAMPPHDPSEAIATSEPPTHAHEPPADADAAEEKLPADVDPSLGKYWPQR